MGSLRGCVWGKDLFDWNLEKHFLVEELRLFASDASPVGLNWSVVGGFWSDIFDGNNYVEGSDGDWPIFVTIDDIFESLKDDTWIGYLQEWPEYFEAEEPKLSPEQLIQVDAVEHLAAFGLWYVSENYDSMGKLPEDTKVGGRNDHGWTREEVTAHRSEILLDAYRVLVRCYSLVSGRSSDEQVGGRVQVRKFLSPSKSGAALADKRHEENRALKRDAIEFWKANIDPNLSAEKAATALQRIVPLSHKLLASLVSSEKKKLRNSPSAESGN